MLVNKKDIIYHDSQNYLLDYGVIIPYMLPLFSIFYLMILLSPLYYVASCSIHLPTIYLIQKTKFFSFQFFFTFLIKISLLFYSIITEISQRLFSILFTFMYSSTNRIVRTCFCTSTCCT